MTGGRRPALGRPPLALLLPAGLALLLLLGPFLGLLGRVPWESLGAAVTDPAALVALRLSVGVATVTTALCVLLGLPLAWVLARVRLPGRSLVRALVTVPLVLPPVVAGVALLALLGRQGLAGRVLFDQLGVGIPFTTAAVVLSHTFVALPFFVLSAEGALRSVGAELDAVAATLGAGRWHTFRRVSLPLVLPGIAAGALLAWARSLGEFGATITFAGNYEGTTRTMPLLVYAELQQDPASAYALSLLMLGLSVLVLALLRERWLGGLAGGAR